MRTYRTMMRAGLVGIAASALAVMASAPAPAQATASPMVLTLGTPAPGTSATLPLGGTVSGITVDWGDGTVTGPYNEPASAQHRYTYAGSYSVSIAGDRLTHFGSGTGYTSELVTAVSSFGSLGITDLSHAFDGAVNLTTVPTSLPPGVTDLSYAFRRAIRVNSPIGGWDTAQVTTMEGMFQGALAFNQPIGSWDTSAAIDLSSMFAEIDGPPGELWSTVFNRPIARWDVSNVTDFSGMFRGNRRFNQPLADWDIREGASMANMFTDAAAFDQPLAAWNLTAPGSMVGIFDGATSLSVRNLSDVLWSIVPYASPRYFEGFGAPDTYVWPAEVYAAVRAYESAMHVPFDLAEPAEPPVPRNPLTLSGDPVVGGTVVASTHELFVGMPVPTVTYRWQYAGDGGWVDLPGATASSLVLPESVGGRLLRVLAIGSNGAGTNAQVVSVNTLGPVSAIEPTAPRAVQAVAGNRSIAASWAAPALTGGTPISSYSATAVSAGSVASACTVAAPARACTLTGLANGTRYTVSVRATNRSGLTGPVGASASAVPRTVPGAVRSITSARLVGGRVTVSWQAPLSNGGAAITGYRVRWRSAGSAVWTSWTSTGLTRGAVWPGWPWGPVGSVQVRAVNAAGAGPVAQAAV